MTTKKVISLQEREALLIMFGNLWQKKYWALDGQNGRPSINDCLDWAFKSKQINANEDLIDFLESFLQDMARRCQGAAKRDNHGA